MADTHRIARVAQHRQVAQLLPTLVGEGHTMKVARVFVMLLVASSLAACERELPTVSTAGTATSIDGVTIKYDVAGEGDPALVFVHCWSCNRGFWDAQWTYFAPRYRVVRLDLAGHGESGGGRQDYTIEAFGADVAAVVEQLNLQHVILIGHSMGGPAAVEAQKRLGDRVVGVVGVDSFHTGFKAPEGEGMAALLEPMEENFPESTGKFVRAMFPPNADPALVERIVATMRAAEKGVALSALKNAFAWQARQSEPALQRLGNKLRNINADTKGENRPLHEGVRLIAGAGHFVAQEKPAEFNAALQAIITEGIGGSTRKPPEG